MAPPAVPERKPSTGIDALVVGAGPAGCFAALEFWRKGHNVTIIERNPEANVFGDFFTVMPQVTRALEKYPAMAMENQKIGHLPWMSYHNIDGTCTSGPGPANPKAAAAMAAALKAGKPIDPMARRVFRHARPKFLGMLLSQLSRCGIEVQYGKRVAEYYETETKGGVKMVDGETMEADIVVAADGIGTKGHSLINGHDIRAVPTGIACFRAAYSVDLIKDDPELNERFKVLENGHPVMEMWHGPACEVVIFRTDETLAWQVMHRSGETMEESWHHTVDTQKVFDYLSEHSPTFPEYGLRLMRKTPPGTVVDYPLMFRDPQPTVSSPKGRVVQIGDGAHSFLPTSGGGANEGIEDALSLAVCLELAGKDNIQLATSTHSKLRFDRISSHQLLGFFNYQRRNDLDHKLPEIDPRNEKPDHGRWLWAHDPEKYAYDNYTAASDSVQNGTPFKNTNLPANYDPKPWGVDEMMNCIKTFTPIELPGNWS